MPNPTKESFLVRLQQDFGSIIKLPRSNSLFDVAGGAVRLYIRYSKLHGRGTTFYGLRKEDLKQIEGRPAFIVFLWDQQTEPLLVPFEAYEQVFASMEPASDGQYKAQVLLNEDATELYLPRLGRFNLEGLFGWEQLGCLLNVPGSELVPELSHSQVQSIVSAIGIAKGYDIWVPQNNRCKLDPDLINKQACREELPPKFSPIFDVLGEIDVVWIEKGANRIHSMFEVEHSTPIYSALLRFNDVHLFSPDNTRGFRIVAEPSRRVTFVKQMNRPTFRASGLNQICTFLEYRNIYGWHKRVCTSTSTSIPIPHLEPSHSLADA
jgi:hypothetical protein